MLRNIKQLKNFRIHATDGEIGRVDQFFFDDQKWAVRYLVVDTGKWLMRNRVLISPLAIKGVDMDRHHIDLTLSREQLENSPDIDTDMPVSRQKEIEYFQYYRWPYYWSGAGIWGTAATLGMYPGGFSNEIPAPPENTAFQQGAGEQPQGDPHLRSTREIKGYRIHAADGEFGHIESVIIDDKTWAIRYLEVDTVNWWPSKSVLIAPEWVTSLSWLDNLAYVDLHKDTIKSAPEYERSSAITREYEEMLHAHYGRAGYWMDENRTLGRTA